MEQPSIENSRIQRIKAWFLIAKPIWLLLTFGFVWLLLEFFLWLLNIRTAVASGGAIMVGTAIISQIYHSRLPVKEAIFGTGQENLKRQRVFPNENIKQIDKNQLDGQQLLYKLSRRTDYVQRPNNSEWILALESVCYRVDKYIAISIATSAAIGTFIWAYGNELFL